MGSRDVKKYVSLLMFMRKPYLVRKSQIVLIEIYFFFSGVSTESGEKFNYLSFFQRFILFRE